MAASRRLIGLSGAGVVLCDTQANGRGSSLPSGVRTAVLADPAPDAHRGWDLATALVRAGAGTLIAPGATLQLPRPWSPSRVAGHAAQTWVDAAELTAQLDGITTRFAVTAGTAPTRIVVQVDRRAARAELRRLVITSLGGSLGERSVRRHGSRVEITLPVTRLDRDTDALCITVHAGDGWRLAGVQGLRGRSGPAAGRPAAARAGPTGPKLKERANTARILVEVLPARRGR
jgi:hypothetical protein